MSLDLKPEVEIQLRAFAEAEGTTPGEYVARLLQEKAQSQRFGTAVIADRIQSPSVLGKYAFVAGGSEEFAQQKQAEINREDKVAE